MSIHPHNAVHHQTNFYQPGKRSSSNLNDFFLHLLFSSSQSPDPENAKDSRPAVPMEMTSDVTAVTPPVTDTQWEAELGMKPAENEASASQQPRVLQLSIRQASLPDSAPAAGRTPALHRPSSDPGLPGQ